MYSEYALLKSFQMRTYAYTYYNILSEYFYFFLYMYDLSLLFIANIYMESCISGTHLSFHLSSCPL